MSDRVRDLLEKALALPREERRALALEILARDDEAPGPTLSPERRAAVLERARGALDGSRPGVPLDVARVRLRAALGLEPAPPA